jgi:hypothetical protein
MTEFLKRFFQPFDPPAAARKMLLSPSFMENERHASYHRNAKLMVALATDQIDEAVQIVTAQWKLDGDSACARGKLLHAVYEHHVNLVALHQEDPSHQFPEALLGVDGHLFGGKECVEPQQFQNFHADRKRQGFINYRTEWKIVAPKEYDLAGTIDLVQIREDPAQRYTEDGKLIVFFIDYKNSDKIVDSQPGRRYAYDHALPPLNHWPDNKETMLNAQLGGYRFMAEQPLYNVYVEDMLGVCFHKNYPNYLIVPCTMARERVNMMMDTLLSP